MGRVLDPGEAALEKRTLWSCGTGSQRWPG